MLMFRRQNLHADSSEMMTLTFLHEGSSDNQCDNQSNDNHKIRELMTLQVQELKMNHIQQPPQTPSPLLNNRPTSSRLSSIDGNACPVPIHTHGLYASGMRPRPQPNVKVRRKCMEVICQPSVIFLSTTILLTSVASTLLYIALTGRYWEMMVYDPVKLQDIVSKNQSVMSVEWFFDDKVPRISFQRYQSPDLLYLFPLHSGVWISCIDLDEIEYAELQATGYNKVRCVDHLNPDSPRPTEQKPSWQHRMQNLAIACALVCLILLGAAIFVGLFGILRRQISAVLVTGVIYVLAATFALFTLTIVHLKHKNRNECDPLDVWTKLTPDLKRTEYFRSARVISHGWSLQLAWAGSFVCLLASVMWILLSKMMRYNPITLTT